MKNEMKKSSLKAVALAVLALSAGVASAQTLPDPLIKAVQKAIVSNPEVQARWHNFTATSAERDAASAGYRPQLDLVAGAGRESQKYPGPTTYLSDYNRSNGSLTLTQMLFDGMFTSSEVKRLGYAKLTRYYELLEASENIGLEALRAYADVARYTELVEEAKANYVEHKQTARHIEERSGAGVSRRVDLEQANGRLSLAESNLLTEVSNLHDVTARYIRIMGEAPPIKMPVLPEGLRLKNIPSSAADAMKMGLVNSPTINAAYENVRSAKAQIESRKAAYMPRVDLRLRETWGQNVNGWSGSSNIQVAEVVMNYNLYRGGYDLAREKQAIESQYQARDLQEKACRDVRQTLAIAYNDVNKLQEQMKYLNQHRLSAEKAREAYRQQFDIGQRTLLDLLDTQNEYFNASRAYIDARYNKIIAEARTLAGMGKLNGTVGVERPGQPSAQDAGQDRSELSAEELCPFAAPELVVVDKDKLMADAPMRARVSVPAPAVVPAPVMPAKVTLSSDALFDFGKSSLKPEGQKNLDDLLSKIKGQNYESIVVVGHTDAMGSDEYNQVLSVARAQSVKSYMLSQGVPDAKVRVEGKGKSSPIASNDTLPGRIKNRRVEITVK
jgi:adhesin transport system outer membrane protein